MAKVTIVNENPWKTSLLLSLVILVFGILLAVGGQGSLKIVLMISGAIILLASIAMFMGSFSSASPAGILVCATGAILGIALIAAPNLFSDVMMVVLAVVLILMGLGSLLMGSWAGASPLVMVIGMAIAAIMVIAGILALLNPKGAADILMLIIGVLLIVSGGLGVYRALQQR